MEICRCWHREAGRGENEGGAKTKRKELKAMTRKEGRRRGNEEGCGGDRRGISLKMQEGEKGRCGHEQD